MTFDKLMPWIDGVTDLAITYQEHISIAKQEQLYMLSYTVDPFMHALNFQFILNFDI